MGRLRIPQRKTPGLLWLLLTDEVGTALLDYLCHGRPALNVRRQRIPVPRRPAAQLSGAVSPLPHADRSPQADGGHRGLPGRVEAKRPGHLGVQVAHLAAQAPEGGADRGQQRDRSAGNNPSGGVH